LAERFRRQVSVELHTDVAHDCEASIAYARRFHEVCPEFFVVKIPFTPAGIIATRTLRTESIPVNMTLGFSARQNYVATALANPSYVNIFLGRLNAYVADNQLGDGLLVGEKATLASQREVKVFALGLPQNETKQIAASVRDVEQLPKLVGIDVITMPLQIAAEAYVQLDDVRWTSQLEVDHAVSLAAGVEPDAVGLDKLWSVADETRKFVEQMILHPPEMAQDLINVAADYRATDLFPHLSDADTNQLAKEGKIPKHASWGDRIMRGELAIDCLMTLAGLLDFARSQAALDERIREHI
jgi:transaldolase